MKIFPNAIAIAMMKEFSIMWITGSRVVLEVPTNRMRL